MTIDETIKQSYSQYALKQIGTLYKHYGIGETNPIYKIGGEHVMFEKVNKHQYKVHPAYKKVFEEVINK